MPHAVWFSQCYLANFLVGIRKEIKHEDKKIGVSLWSGKACHDYLCKGKFHPYKSGQTRVMLHLEPKGGGNPLRMYTRLQGRHWSEHIGFEQCSEMCFKEHKEEDAIMKA